MSKKQLSPDVVTANEAAEALGVHVYTVYQLLRAGHLEGFRIQTHWRIPRKSVESFIGRNKKREEVV